MNSNYGKTGINSFDFDLGIGNNRARSLNDQKNKTNSYSYSSTSSFTQPVAKPTPSWQPNKPSWTHQPAPVRPAGTVRTELGGPTSMVGDIFGKSWNSVAPPSGSGAGIGVAVNKDPSLFGDLVSSALGQNKSTGSAPLKSAAPAKSSFSMGGMANSLPKANAPANGMNKGSTPSMSSFSGGGGIGGRGGGLGTSSQKDPFGSLVDFRAKPSSGGGTLNSAATGKANPVNSDDFGFGNFQNANSTSSADPLNLFSSSNSASVGSTQKPFEPSGFDSFDMFFSQSSSSASGASMASTTQQAGTQQFSGGDDWGMETGFGEHDTGNTTELEGLPPPPAGVSASTTKSKGMDNYKQGQYADAIKWLSWAVILLGKTDDADGKMEVLSCRASCYKEVGEYKKAVADCTEVLEHDEKNVSVLVQRALLYESMEKYKLGADDLRAVMKIDPLNRVARSTIHRLNKMAG